MVWKTEQISWYPSRRLPIILRPRLTLAYEKALIMAGFYHNSPPKAIAVGQKK